MPQHFHRGGRSRRNDARTWLRLLSLPRLVEFFISVDHFPTWRRHIAWSQHNGTKLRDHMVQRFASNMVFMTLLLSSDVAVLFSPSNPSEIMRQKLLAGAYDTFDFWAGLFVCISLFLCLCTVLSTFTAWAVLSTVSGNNAHCIIRSSAGLHATQLPSRIIILAIYSFVTWALLFMFILMPLPWAIVVTACTLALLVHIISTYSSLGRLVMYTSAMGEERIFDVQAEESMLPYDLLESLVDKALEEKLAKTKVTEQYRKEGPHTPISMGDIENGSVRSRQRQRREEAQDSKH